MKNLFNSNNYKSDNNTGHRLSEPTFRHPNFLSRSESADTANGAVAGYNKAASLDYRTNNGNVTGGVSVGQQGVKKVKCVFLGDAKVGKTSLIVSYTTNGYPKDYVPTAFDNFSVLVKVDNQPVQLQICDTAGQAGFDSLRPLCYPNTDVFVLCFSVVDPDSFYNLHNKWLPEIKNFLDNNDAIAKNDPRHRKSPGPSLPPLLLIGTQSDRRSNVSTILDLSQCGETAIRPEEAVEYSHEIGALRFVECSALTQHNLKEVFDACILAALKMPIDNDDENNKTAKGGKSKIVKARNLYSQEFNNLTNNNNNHCAARKSFKKLKDKMKRSNSVDSAKYASVQVRRQLSNGRINHVGLSSSNQAKDTLKLLAQEKAKLDTSSSFHASKIAQSNIKLIDQHQYPTHSSQTLPSVPPHSPSNSKLVKFSFLKSGFSPSHHSKNSQSKDNNGSPKKETRGFFAKNGRKMSSKSFDSFSCGGGTPKSISKHNQLQQQQMQRRKFSAKGGNSSNEQQQQHGTMTNNDMMQEIDKLKKGWRKLLCIT